MPWGQKRPEAAVAAVDHCHQDRPPGPMVDSEAVVPAAVVEARSPVAEAALPGLTVDSGVAVPAAVAQAQILAVEAQAQALMAGCVAKVRAEAPAQPGLMAGCGAVVPAGVLEAQVRLGLTAGPEVVVPAAVQAQVLAAGALPADRGVAVLAVLQLARPGVLGALAQRRRFRAAMVPRERRKVVLPARAASLARRSAATG
jgi:hypothetical protein